jgi:predicted transport protein
VTLINELTRVNIRVNPKERTFPYVEISDFGECDTSFKDVALTEAKLHCYVKRDYKGIEKARLFSRNVLDVIAGEHDVGDYRVKIQYTANLEHNEGDAAYVTLILAVTRVSKLK